MIIAVAASLMMIISKPGSTTCSGSMCGWTSRVAAGL